MFEDPDILEAVVAVVVVPAVVGGLVIRWVLSGTRDRARRADAPPRARAAPAPPPPPPIILEPGDEPTEAQRAAKSLAELRRRFDDVVGERTALSEGLGSARQEISRLNDENAQLRSGLARLHAELQAQERELERLRPAPPAAAPPPAVAPAPPPAPARRLTRDLAPGDEGPLQGSTLDAHAMRFDGGPDALAGADPFDGLSDGAWTVELWLRPRPAGRSMAVLSYVNARGLHLGLYLSPELELGLQLGRHRSGVAEAVPLVADRWQHLAVAWSADGGALRVMLDGAEVYSGELGAGAQLPPGGRLLIGQEGIPLWGDVNPELGFEGDMAELRVWRRARDEGAVAADHRRRVRGGAGVAVFRA
jgi:hypothetical protein